MNFVWDYDPQVLAKSEKGRVLLLERLVNFGPQKGEKINLSEVKKYWHRLNLFPKRKKLMELLIWGEIQS